MHILFFTHDIDTGGSARSLFILVQELVKRHTISIVSFVLPEKGKPIAPKYQELGISLYFFPWGWIPLSFIGCETSFEYHKKVCVQHRKNLPQVKTLGQTADVICFNSYAPSSLAQYFPGKQKILMAREVLHEKSSPNYHTTISMLKQNIDFAIAIGPQEAHQLESIGIPHEIIYNSSKHKPYFEPFLPLPPIRFGMFAQFIPSKGLDILLLACAEQAHTLKEYNAHVHLFGINPNIPSTSLETIQAFIKSYELTEHIHLEGWVNNVEECMANMHCMIRPDRTGSPWGRDIIEAMSIGRPLLASGDENVFVKNGQTGYLFPAGNTAILGKILKLIAQEPDVLEVMGKQATTFAKEHFDPEVNSARIEHIFMRNTSPKLSVVKKS